MKIVFFTAVLLILVPVALIVADEKSPSKFEAAKATYEAEISKLDNAIAEAIDNRLAQAQKSGNIRAVDVCLTEKKAFLEYGDLPLQTPTAQQRRLSELAKTMDKAYSDELKLLTKEKKIPLAKALMKEQQSFHQRIAIRTTRITLMGDWKLQMAGGYSSVFTFYPDGTMFHSTENFHGTWRIDLDTQQIIVAPPGSTAGDKINLPLNPKGTNGLSSSGGAIKLTKK